MDGMGSDEVSSDEGEVEQEPLTIPMDIVEVEYTVQGEGMRIGIPSLIIRMSGCNKKCIWCDVKKKKVERKYNMKSMIHILSQYAEYDLVVTGGEPFTQPDALGLFITVGMTVREARGFTSEIIVETNGSISPEMLKYGVNFEDSRLTDEIIEKVLWSVSPKLHSSGDDWHSAKFREFMKLPKVQFKFTVNPFDLDDIADLKNILFFIPPEIPVILSPVVQGLESYDHEGYQRLLMELFKLIIDMKYPNVRLLPQMQKVIWGLTRESI